MTKGVERDLLAYLRQGRLQLLSTDGASPSADTPDTEALLVSQRGSRIAGQSLLLRVKTLAERAGLNPTEIRLHTLRHAIATHLLAGEMPLEEIRRFLGHESLESTQLYTHLVEEL
jgi:integrase/recombinase XerD